MFKWIDSFLDKIFVAFGGIFFSQAPQYMLQYKHRLAGHIAELQVQIKMLRESAGITGKTLEQYMHKFLTSHDDDFIHQGKFIKNMLLRYEDLQAGLAALQEATPWTKPWALARHFQPDIAEAAFRDFQAGISFNLETMSWMIVGMFLGFVVYQGLRCLLTSGLRKRIAKN